MVVLVIEDEPGIADFLRRGLESAGFVVDMAADGQLGLLAAQRGRTCRPRPRPARPARRAGTPPAARYSTGLPVIVLTAKDAVADRVANLDAGADDYVVKPFSFAELLARVRYACGDRISRRPWCCRPAD